MKKKKEKASVYHDPRDYLFYKDIDYTDEKQIMKMVNRTFDISLSRLKHVNRTKPYMTSAADLSGLKKKRRVNAVIESIPLVRDLVKDVASNIQGIFSIEEEWAYVNSLPIASYDIIENFHSLSVAAAIWMLDKIKDAGKISEALQILSEVHGDFSEMKPSALYDPVHDKQTIFTMAYLIQHRNDDCDRGGKKSNAGKNELSRVFVDDLVVLNRQNQDVPSRNLFNRILSLITPEDIKIAVTHYESDFKEIIEAFYQCRYFLAKKHRALDRKHKQLSSDMNEDLNTFKKVDLTNNVLLTSPDRTAPNSNNSGNSIVPFVSGVGLPMSLKAAAEYEDRFLEISDEFDSLSTAMTLLVFRFGGIWNSPSSEVEEEYGSTIAEIIQSKKNLIVVDPYESCFSLLYLLETGSELPWLYFPSIVLMQKTASMLPWVDSDYDEMLDDLWEKYYSSERETLISEEDTQELVKDWYELKFLSTESDGEEEECSQLKNLAQVMYSLSGCIIPRSLYRQKEVVEILNDYGIEDESLISSLLLCMSILGETRFQTRMGGFKSDLESSDDPGSEDISESDIKASYEDLLKENASLKAEIKQLKKSSYDANRALQETQNDMLSLQQKISVEHRELSELREMLFEQSKKSDSDELEDEINEEEFPYNVNRTTVVFGGHETWSKAIRPMFTGDIRFVDREMQPDSDLIRNAEVIWIQPNSLSHSMYYKIIRLVRVHKIPLHYFRYASQKKCAMQLIAADKDK